MKVDSQYFIQKKGRVDYTNHIEKECFQPVNEAC